MRKGLFFKDPVSKLYETITNKNTGKDKANNTKRVLKDDLKDNKSGDRKYDKINEIGNMKGRVRLLLHQLQSQNQQLNYNYYRIYPLS